MKSTGGLASLNLITPLLKINKMSREHRQQSSLDDRLRRFRNVSIRQRVFILADAEFLACLQIFQNRGLSSQDIGFLQRLSKTAPTPCTSGRLRMAVSNEFVQFKDICLMIRADALKRRVGSLSVEFVDHLAVGFNGGDFSDQQCIAGFESLVSGSHGVGKEELRSGGRRAAAGPKKKSCDSWAGGRLNCHSLLRCKVRQEIRQTDFPPL